MFAFHTDRPIGIHDDRQVLLAACAHEHGTAAVNKTLGQPLVQRVGELVLDDPRPLLPVRRVIQPVAAVGNKCPGPGVGNARHQRVDIAIGPVKLGKLCRHPIRRQAATGLAKILKDARQ